MRIHLGVSENDVYRIPPKGPFLLKELDVWVYTLLSDKPNLKIQKILKKKQDETGASGLKCCQQCFEK